MFKEIKCDRCEAVLESIPLFSIRKFIFLGYQKNGMIKQNTNNFINDEVAYAKCLWCGNDLSKRIKTRIKDMKEIPDGIVAFYST